MSYQLYNFVDIGYCDGKPNQYVCTQPRLVEEKLGAAGNYFLSECDESIEQIQKI